MLGSHEVLPIPKTSVPSAAPCSSMIANIVTSFYENSINNSGYCSLYTSRILIMKIVGIVVVSSGTINISKYKLHDLDNHVVIVTVTNINVEIKLKNVDL
ncbi:unnamed protein product [Acanthoscelides obtectus]|uniref:Uncharacterized protein n=1 Tax=Acanthoscelides obtectus TaxID=200917 RepID=A0A9P0JNI3_ACAOB|nr:unnamed protein product [Acanthoscelides obtectus]CAK1662121.1 hypothetical protein AOBTE_LOCUS22997 [Acanthoscelides obtectus]